MPKKKRFSLFSVVISAFLLLSFILIGCGKDPTAGNKTGGTSSNVVRIGYQKNGPLVILKSLGTLEKSLVKEGYKVEWKEFQDGPTMLEALNAGAIDFARTGNSPPIFAQAAGTPFVYIAAGKSKYEGSAILVPKNSPIQSIKELKGKTVGFSKGSSSHYFLIKALEKNGMQYQDIKPAFLSPGDGRVALEQGKIDAWVVWDPFTASAQVNSGARVLVNGKGYTTDRDFFLANVDYAKKNQKVIDLIMKEVKNSSTWANDHHTELIKMLAPLLKIDEKSLTLAANRRTYGVDELSPEILKEQQEIADTFYKLGIIPKKVTVEDAVAK